MLIRSELLDFHILELFYLASLHFSIPVGPCGLELICYNRLNTQGQRGTWSYSPLVYLLASRVRQAVLTSLITIPGCWGSSWLVKPTPPPSPSVGLGQEEQVVEDQGTFLKSGRIY